MYDKRLLSLLFLPLAFACGDDEADNGDGNGTTGPDSNIVELALATPELSTLAQLVQDAGLVGTLSNESETFTVFAPTNDAFGAVDQQTLDFLAANPDVLRDLLLYHVVPGEALGAADLVGGSASRDTALSIEGSVQTLTTAPSGGTVSVTDGQGNARSVGTADVQANNGVVHLIDGVLLFDGFEVPDEGAEDNIVDLALATPNLSTLAQLVQDANLTDTLSDESATFTVFAPSNDAFAALPQAALDFLSNNPNVLQQVLLYHVLPGDALDASELAGMASSRGTALDLMGTTQTVETAPSGDTVSITDGQGNVRLVEGANVEASNGIVHVIDGVLLFTDFEIPSEDPSLAEIAMGPDFTTLLQAATDLQLAAALADPMADLTVFAPTNTAFTNLGVNLADLSEDVLANILLAHLGNPAQDAAALTTAGSFATLSNLTLPFDGMANPPTVGGAAIATPDQAASNGIAHVMSEVIVPPTILDIAAGVPDLSTLASLVTQQASPAIADALSPDVLAGDDPITVFAPTDGAFGAIQDLAGSLSQSELDAVLSYHVIPSFALGADLQDGDVLPTALANASVTVRIDGNGLQLEDEQGNRVNVSAVNDVRGLDGVVHVIDGVLLPSFTIGTRAALRSDLTALNGALQATGLDQVVSDPSQTLTVFAPTDAAFTNLGVNLGSVSPDVVANILLSHVVGSVENAADLSAAGSFDTLASLSYTFDGVANPPTAGGAPIAAADVPAQNGIIHLLDAVIVPPTTLQAAAATPALSTLVDVVTNQASAAIPVALDPQTLTNGDQPITVLAPTNQAFTDASAVVSGLSQSQLDLVLQYHVIPGQVLSGNLMNGDTVTTAAGQTLTVVSDAMGVGFEDAQGNVARVATPDIRTTSGTVHVIDSVLVPTLP